MIITRYTPLIYHVIYYHLASKNVKGSVMYSLRKATVTDSIRIYVNISKILNSNANVVNSLTIRQKHHLKIQMNLLSPYRKYQLPNEGLFF